MLRCVAMPTHDPKREKEEGKRDITEEGKRDITDIDRL